MAFNAENWAYKDIKKIYDFCQWADGQTDLSVVFNKGREVSEGNQFLTMALVGYIHKREQLEKQEVKA